VVAGLPATTAFARTLGCASRAGFRVRANLTGVNDPDVVLRQGPWQHRMVPAHGTRIHAALTGPEDGPLVVLLHGFPQCWYTWRRQMTDLAGSGYRVAALDLRGYGASDKPPGRYDIPVLAGDVAAVIRSLGAADAAVVGQGLGGVVAWSMPALTPDVVSGVGVLGSPHPSHLHRTVARSAPVSTLRWLSRVQVPWFPERAMTRGPMVRQVLDAWSAPGWNCADAEFYEHAMRLPFSAHSAMEQVRWLVRSAPRSDGRAYRRTVAPPARVPVLSLHGRADRFLPPAATALDRQRTAVGYHRVVIEGAGRFLTEEAPEEVSAALTRWLTWLNQGD